ncbi:MAG: hypothetical protein WBX04_09230 [Candidatus Sulfotelmatobacter sp.]
MNSKSWNRLFPEADLLRWQAEYEAQQLAERQREVAARLAAHERRAPKKEFVYRSRPAADWDARADQCEPEDNAFIYQARSPELWAERADQRTPCKWEMSHGHWRLTAEGRKQLAEKVQIMLDLARKFQAEITIKELAARTNRSQAWVRTHLKRNGIVLASQRQKGRKS